MMLNLFRKKDKYYISLRVRSFILITLISTSLLFVMRYVLINSYHLFAITQRQNDLLNQCLIISNHISDYDYLNDSTSELINGEINQLSTMYNGRIMVIDGNFKIITDTFNLDKGKINISSQVIDTYKNNKNYIKYNTKHSMIELVLPIHNKDITSENSVVGIMCASISTDVLEDSLYNITKEGYLVLTILLILLFVSSFIIINIIFNPFKKIANTLSSLSEGNDDFSLEESRYVETKDIVNNFNRIFYKMKSLDNSRQEFVSNVSHELKTPMASIKVLADSIVSNPDTSIEIYKEFMTDITEEIDRENRIITELLSLVKLDKKANNMIFSLVDINLMIERILKLLRPLASEKKVDIVFESYRTIVAEIDENKLSSAITNIVENAIKYNKDSGWVHVSINSDHLYLYIKISDNGIGIPKEDLEHIFERFYRVDKSHSRQIGGTGLGLAITKSVINLHQGSIGVTSIIGEGTSFDIRLPLVQNKNI